MTLRGINIVDSHCVPTEAVWTNAPTRPHSPRAFPQTKTAIAIWGHATSAQIERLQAPYDDAARRVTRVIVSLTQSIEADRAEGTWNSPLARDTAQERGRVPVHVVTLARGVVGGHSYYFFEARKRYAVGFDVFVNGWVGVTDPSIQLTLTQGDVTDWDYKGVETAQVLGALTLADRIVWVLVMHSYESEAYELMELPAYEPLRRAIRIAGGSC